MDSKITVADARAAFARFSYSSAEFLRKLNRSCEHFLNSNVYDDLFTIVEVTTSTGYITVPRQFGRAYGVQVGKCAKAVSSQWVEFVEYGLGRQDPAEMCLDGLIDMGNHFVTQQDLYADGVEVPAALRIRTNSSDDGKNFRFFGMFNDPLDGRDREIIDVLTGVAGVNIVSGSTSVGIGDTTYQFKTITGIQAPSGLIGRWMLYKVVAGVETLLGIYDPTETRPKYVRYKIRLTNESIRLFCRRKHVLLLADTDFVYPDNLDAMEHGFNACMYRDKGSLKSEYESWDAGKKVLKEEYYAAVPAPRTFLTSELGHGRRIWGLPQ